jgi:hypothetical protein
VVGRGLAAVSDVLNLYLLMRVLEEAYHDVGGLDSTLCDMGSNKLRHSPLSKMDMEAGISLFLHLSSSHSEVYRLTQPVQVVLSR